MVKYSIGCLAVFALRAIGTDAFVVPFEPRARTTELHAFAPPTMIIGPMIKKMREEQAKKKMPMATPQEASYEAPGLRVGSGAWKWPPVWPYDGTFFTPKEDISSKTPDIGGMAGMLTGMPQVNNPDADVEVDTTKKLNALKYWGEDNAEVATNLDEDAVEKVKSHYAFYLRDGMSVLELGAAENSYLPEGLKLSRHVGVGANQKMMEKNPALTETLVVDLNDAIEDRDVNSEELRRLALEPFDAIIMANTVDFLTSPREVFRSAWYLLKPGGIMINIFSTKDAYGGKFQRAQTKMWRDFNDDQHMWICGSFFQFSAGDGWESIKGFDISPESAKEADDSPLSFLKQGKTNNVYAVQATKGYQAETIDENDPEASFRSKMWMLPTMEERDKMLVAPRMRRAYEAARTEEEKAALANNVEHLPEIYESLIKMDQFAFTFSMQAQLAVDLIVDPDFRANDEQIMALKQGLGLRSPSKEFWEPVGQQTSGMTVENKINLLAHIVPRFGSGNPEQEAALDAFVAALKPTFAVVRSKCPDLNEADVQLLGTELLAAEVLKAGRSTREEFASWLGALTGSEMKQILEERKRFKLEATEELKAYRAARAEEEARKEEERQKMQEQVEKARKERTMALNPKTGKMELLKK